MKDKLKWLGKKFLHILISFLIGLAIATTYHIAITNQKVRTTAEAVCENFGRDEKECKEGIDDVLDMSDNEVQNNINVEEK